MATNTNGLIYYKLDANINGYPGDITKNCGLRGEEIDGNFNFLRGNDIKEISFDGSGVIYLTRYNGEIMIAKPVDKPSYDFQYDPEHGTLTITTPDGEDIVLNGFKVNTTVFHDYTMEGYGSPEEPLEVSNLSKPGRYRPAIELIDTTGEYAPASGKLRLPVENVSKHDRYVTREKISRFGRLYPLKGVENISKRLKSINSEWRIPTKSDWDRVLNVIDCAEPNHNSNASNINLGEFAGSALKANKYWLPINNKVLSEDKYGFSIYPVGYTGNRGTKYYGSFGESAAFWTATEEDNHRDMFVKLFEYNTEKVGQRTWGENYYLSLRLVKPFTGDNFRDAEDIDGYTANCVHIPGTDLIWTRENVAFSNEQYDGFLPEEWEHYENIETDDNSYDIRYFINDWNGLGWDKHEMKEGEGIVLYKGSHGAMHEWLLVDGELIDTSVLLKEEFQHEIDNINKRLDAEVINRVNSDAQIWEGINKEIKAREEVDTQLWGAINQEAQARESVDAQIWEGINKESQARESVDAQLWEAINQEAVTRAKIDKQQWESINQEVQDRTEADKLLFANLTKETEDRVTVDNQIWSVLNDEISNRNLADADLQKQINENKVIGENNSVVIVPGSTVAENTVPTTIKVNLDVNCEHLKLGDTGIYFDGYFGQF